MYGGVVLRLLSAPSAMSALSVPNPTVRHTSEQVGKRKNEVPTIFRMQAPSRRGGTPCSVESVYMVVVPSHPPQMKKRLVVRSSTTTSSTVIGNSTYVLRSTTHQLAAPREKKLLVRLSSVIACIHTRDMSEVPFPSSCRLLS